jgi:hypothetical protein
MFEESGYEVIKTEGINKISSLKFQIFNFMTIGLFNDTKYLQYVCVSKQNNRK